jgi:hypothetical protein
MNTVRKLGLLYSKLENPKKAEVMFQRALDGHLKILGSEHEFDIRSGGRSWAFVLQAS